MGRTALMLVIAFNVTFMLMGFRISAISSKAYEKYIAYQNIEQANLTMESAANIAISQAFVSGGTPDSSQVISFMGGTYTAKRTNTAPFRDQLLVTGTFNGVQSTTAIMIQSSSFSQFAFYSQTEMINGNPIYWITGDICRGPLHTQDFLYVSGNPVFQGMVTTKNGVQRMNPSDNPAFNGGYKKGVDVIIPTDLTDLKYKGAQAQGGEYINGLNTYVEFLKTGKVIVRTGSNGWSESSTAMNTGTNSTIPKCTTYASVAAVAASGVLLVNNADLHVKGQLNGRITLGNVGSGRILIDSSVVYATDPPTITNPTAICDDMLGLVADNDVHISLGAENNKSPQPVGLTIDASIFSRTGGFGSENYDTRAKGGVLKIIGGVQQLARDPVGTFSNGVIQTGFQKDYDYDTRLQSQSPEGYPRLPFQVQNWVDDSQIDDTFWN
jgi:hypothetical protein